MINAVNKNKEVLKMKKLLLGLTAAAIAAASTLAFTGCNNSDKIYVATNVPFAPFEYEDLNSGKIIGVDVEIMNKVGEKLGKDVVFENMQFEYIIDNVASGKQYDCGAAGLTVTPERKELVDFSNTYFVSVQYVVYKNGEFTADQIKTDGDTSYILWDELAGMNIGVQRNTTGDIYVSDEIDGGVLKDTDADCTPYDDVMVAVQAIASNAVDVVVIDKLPAQYVVQNSTGYSCVALYYAGEDGEKDEPTSEEYAIAVTKGNTELLNAINEVLADLGEEGINALVSKYLGIS
ncbi:MAG: transporter substrate-binding domain-containing protein, partial [Clostridia bacterium]|nr:transporter substrate-binding domain-containing protein [Clostridia bacterium]